MKLRDVKGTYNQLLKDYNFQKQKLEKQKKELEEKIKTTENGAVIYANEAVKLELTYNVVSEKYDEYEEYMSQLMKVWNAEFNKVAAEQQADAAEEYGKEMGKILTIARRIMKGDIVPLKDEKKLMEFDSGLYQMAKNIGLMAKNREKQKHKSLWEDEEKKEYQNPVEVADNIEISGSGPEIVSVEDTMAAVSESSTEME